METPRLPRIATAVETLDGSEVYRVERTWIVDPEDVSVLDPTPVRSLTLVTCYPFYFIGSAPRRFMSGRSEPTKRFQKGEAAERDVSLGGVPGVSTVRSRRAAYPG
jgi:hypothetical protein